MSVNPFSDDKFSSIPGLTWLPWVGEKYCNVPPDQRILVIGESHYTNEKDPDKARETILDCETKEPDYNQSVVAGCGYENSWRNRSFDKLHAALGNKHDRARKMFWLNAAYLNIIQRMMWYCNPSGPERPSWDDFKAGWQVINQVIEVLQPRYCLFMGVTAAYSFECVMKEHNRSYTAVEFPEKVGKTWARRAGVQLSGSNIEIHFIQHCGTYFSPARWHDYLLRHAPGFMAALSSPAYQPGAFPLPSEI